MNKNIIIHNNNINIKLFSNRIKFNAPDNVDYYISTNIIPALKTKKFDVIFIKDNLSANYLELLGLRLAYHIRLSPELEDKRFYPIVILSDINSHILNKFDFMSKILFTKNIFIIKNTKEDIDKISNKNFYNLTETQYKDYFLNKIEVEQPKDYLTHHSITNEWAIDQWAYLLDVKTDAIINNRNKIAYMLYYKYIKAKYHLENKTAYANKKPTRKDGKILLIDDKAEDGWNDILTAYTQNFYTDVELHSLDGITKDSTIDDIKQLVILNIEEYNPDVIILDLRLLHNEELNQKINKISGYQILQYIKKLNPSIQIIMFTASSDSFILEELYKKNILGYIKKDSPLEKYVASKSSFSKLDKLIKFALEKKYLKDIYKTSQQIESLNLINSCSKDKKATMLEIQNSVSQVFEILNSNMANSFLYAMYAINKTLELIVKVYMIEKYDYTKRERIVIWIDSNREVNLDYNSTENKLYTILKEKLSINNENIQQNIHKIICCRNYNIHGGEEKSHCIDGLIKKPNEKNLVEWFGMIYIILKQFKAKL